MKKVLLTILAIIVVIGALAGAGFTGYRIGYQQGALADSTGNTRLFMHGFQFGPQDMPMHNFSRDFNRNFNRGFGPGDFGMHGRGMEFGFFPPLMVLGRIAFWGLIIWFAYWLFTKSGWRLTRTPQPVENPKAETSTPEEKEA